MRHILERNILSPAYEGAHWLRRRWRNAPRQHVYCVVGMLLGLGAPVEFAVLLPLTTKADAVAAGTRIAGEVALSAGARGVTLSVSVGVAEFDADNSASLESLLTAADRALYEAKSARDGQPFEEVARRPSMKGYPLALARTIDRERAR